MGDFPIHFFPSPNYDDRNGVSPKFIILHYTDLPDITTALNYLAEPNNKVSAHVVIDQDGSRYQMVATEKIAWHAGVSAWRGYTNLNRYSLGIELQNGGVQYLVNGEMENFSESQISSLLQQLQIWTKEFGIPPENILAHSDIAPARKIDPGPKFPWAVLAKRGLCYDMNQHAHILNLSDIALKQQLVALGYDEKTELSFLKRAFQLRLDSK